MTDFMKWLYPNYIKPQLDAVPTGDYGFHFALIDSELGPHALESYEKILEFTAANAFLLGIRTGAGLAGAPLPQNPPFTA